METIKRTLHHFAASQGVLQPGEQVVIAEEPAGTLLIVAGRGVFNLSFDGAPVSAEAIAAAARFDLRVRAEVVFAGNDAPVALYAVLSPAHDAVHALDCYLGTVEHGRWLHDEELDAVCTALVLPRAPVIYRGPFTEPLTHDAAQVSVRPVVERSHPDLGRVIFTHEKENDNGDEG